MGPRGEAWEGRRDVVISWIFLESDSDARPVTPVLITSLHGRGHPVIPVLFCPSDLQEDVPAEAERTAKAV